MKSRFIVLLIVLIGSVSAKAGGGWVPKKGEGFFMLSHRVIAGSNFANSEAMFGRSPFAMVQTTNLYGEFGLGKRFGVVFYSPILTVSSQDAGVDVFGGTHVADSDFGLGDIDVAFKYQILDRKYKLSGSVLFGLNTGNHRAGEFGMLHLGDGEFNQMLRLDFSHGFKSFWWNLYGGFNNRTLDNSDEIHGGGELGWKKNKLSVLLKIDGKFSLFNGSRAESISPSIYSNNQEYLGVSPQLLYEFENHFGLMLETGFALHARNIIAAPSLSAGVFFNLKK
jgi:hypothetical protein